MNGMNNGIEFKKPNEIKETKKLKFEPVKLDDKELKAKGNEFISFLESNKYSASVNEFLESIAPYLKKACELKVSFETMKKGIKATFERDISIGLIKRFCIKKGYHKPQKRNVVRKEVKDDYISGTQ